MNNTNVMPLPKRNSLISKFADRFSVDEEKVVGILKATAFKQRDNAPVSDEQVMALMIVADQYGLNPWTKEIYAYPDKQNGIVPVVGVDGWSRIINEHKQLDGIEFTYSTEKVNHKGKPAHEWIECVITRKDRTKAIVVREYFDEVVRLVNFSTPWDSHPKRMHRHKALIQGARIAFGFAGIYDDDEAQRIIEKDITNDATVVGHQQSTYAPTAPDFYSDEEFEANTIAWKKAIENGKAPDRFIAFIESRGKSFTETQKQIVMSWGKPDSATTNPPIDGDFVSQIESAEKGVQ